MDRGYSNFYLYLKDELIWVVYLSIINFNTSYSYVKSNLDLIS